MTVAIACADWLDDFFYRLEFDGRVDADHPGIAITKDWPDSLLNEGCARAERIQQLQIAAETHSERMQCRAKLAELDKKACDLALNACFIKSVLKEVSLPESMLLEYRQQRDDNEVEGQRLDAERAQLRERVARQNRACDQLYMHELPPHCAEQAAANDAEVGRLDIEIRALLTAIAAMEKQLDGSISAEHQAASDACKELVDQRQKLAVQSILIRSRYMDAESLGEI